MNARDNVRQDPDSGVWLMDRATENWIAERTRELAGEAFDNLVKGSDDWIVDATQGEMGSNARVASLDLLRSAVRYAAFPHADNKDTLDRDYNRLRDEWIEQKADDYEPDAWTEWRQE